MIGMIGITKNPRMRVIRGVFAFLRETKVSQSDNRYITLSLVSIAVSNAYYRSLDTL